jgi:hypothetical protein
MMRNTIKRNVNIIPQNIEDPINPRAQNPEIEDTGIGPNNLRLDITRMMNRNLVFRRNSPEEYEKVLM